MLCVLAKMLHILLLCPVLLISGAQTLTIDSQLGTSIEDCFERVSIGEQLPTSAIYRNVTELTARECEQICRQDKQCQTFDYGVGAKGNATCDLSSSSEKEVHEAQVRNPDYDLYARRIQCEQSPPRPMVPLADELEGPESNDRPQHRPVFRPDVDNRPLTGDYIISGDIDPYGLGNKPYRPDDISQRPALDIGPSYGDHKPQDMSYPDRFKPQNPYRPLYTPNDPYKPDPFEPSDSYRPNKPQQPEMDPYRPDSYRPNKPQSEHQKPKPENDILHFGFEKPNSHIPERPNYNYVIRPNRKPRPNDYLNPEKPTYNYNSQYASNYGQNTQNDNSLYVEIYDPPRPYIPIKDRPIHHDFDQGFLGYGTYSSQNSYTNSQNDYSGTITEINKPYRPNQYDQSNQSPYGQRPNDKYKPTIQNSYNHGSYNPQSSYNQNQRPQPSYNKPSYNDEKDGYGQNGPNTYGSSDFQGSYSSSFQGQSSQGYGFQGSYEGNQGYYGNQGSLGSNNLGSYSNSGYGNRPVFDYETQKPGYGNQNPAYNYQKPYGNSKPDYDSPKPGYGQKPDYNYPAPGYNQKPDYDNLNGYGSPKPDYGRPKPGYGSQTPDYDSPKPGYGQKPNYDNLDTGYGSQKPEYNTPKPGYGQKPDYDNGDTGYGTQKPGYNTPKPGYGSSKPDYNPKPGYGSQTPDYDTQKPGYGQPPEYDRPKPGYGNTKPDYDTKPGYGSSKPDYDVKPGYGSQKPGNGNERPDPDYHRPGQKPGYGNEPDIGYGSGPSIKPVYEYEIDKPTNVPTYITKPGGGIVTSRPVVIQDYERPVYKHRGSYSLRDGYATSDVPRVPLTYPDEDSPEESKHCRYINRRYYLHSYCECLPSIKMCSSLQTFGLRESSIDGTYREPSLRKKVP